MAGNTSNINRKDFLRISSGSVAAAVLARLPLKAGELPPSERPNFLWISTEDISPDLGCYGDSYSVTPNIDRFAARGVRYTSAFSHSGVCAPTRSGIITGMYPTTIGTHQMRCQGVPPADVKCFSEYLRTAGYYCTNNSKTDYQFAPPFTAWDESSRKAHWRNRGAGQPFFAVINFTISHESQIRNYSESHQQRLASLKPGERHDPAQAQLPPYYPDTPLVRKDWAQYYDNITLMDHMVGEVLAQLEEDGLAEDTIVWFWGDHGRGLPRAKRWIYDSGLQVPLIIRVPAKYRQLALHDHTQTLAPGSVNDDLVAFIDFAPTMLSLAGVRIPGHIQGRAFLGSQKAPAREAIFAARDRMDEAYDLIRAVRDKRYKYIRNYMSHLTYGQDLEYMNLMPTMQELRRLHKEGQLTGAERQYFRETKPVEELYDIVNDPHEVHNLADDPKNKKVLKRMRKLHEQWVLNTGDMGLIPEPEFDEMKRPGNQWQTTAAPILQVPGIGSGRKLVLNCSTAGASIGYRINGRTEQGWQLYSGPIEVQPGQTIVAKAGRIGFRDSDELTWKVGDPLPKVPEAKETGTPHWRETLAELDLLKRLRTLKAFDGQGSRAVRRYLKALKDPHASVRYWAVVGLHYSGIEPAGPPKVRTALEAALHDDASVVRIAAAQALCDWGATDQGLPVLTAALGDDAPKVRLHAVIALDKLGENARPVLAAVMAALEDKDGYVQRVARHIMAQLGESS